MTSHAGWRSGPGYWMNEASGVLRPVVEAYLQGAVLNPAQIAVMRAYLRQWIMAPVWDTNPYLDAEGRAWLADMRAGIDGLTTHQAITLWLDDVVEEWMDPL